MFWHVWFQVDYDPDEMDLMQEADLDSLEDSYSDNESEVSGVSGTSLRKSISLSSNTSGGGSNHNFSHLLHDEHSIKEFAKVWATYAREYGTRLPVNRLPDFLRLLMELLPIYRLLVRPNEVLEDRVCGCNIALLHAVI